MLGPFPTWFEFRARGKPYSIYIRGTWYPNFTNIDPQESEHLGDVLKKMTLCSFGSDDFLTNPTLEFTWSRPGLYQYYIQFPIPYMWRFPFLDYLNECFGPAGSKPTHINPNSENVTIHTP